MKNDQLTTAIATCRACLIADTMKDCPRCAFVSGLPFKALKSLDADYPKELREARIKALTDSISKA